MGNVSQLNRKGEGGERQVHVESISGQVGQK